MRFVIFVSAMSLMGTGVALADQTADPVTVNDYTPAQKDAALSAARAAGYTGGQVTMFQAGDFFVRADKGGQVYQLTVRRDGKVFASMPAG